MLFKSIYFQQADPHFNVRKNLWHSFPIYGCETTHLKIKDHEKVINSILCGCVACCV